MCVLYTWRTGIPDADRAGVHLRFLRRGAADHGLQLREHPRGVRSCCVKNTVVARIVCFVLVLVLGLVLVLLFEMCGLFLRLLHCMCVCFLWFATVVVLWFIFFFFFVPAGMFWFLWRRPRLSLLCCAGYPYDQLVAARPTKSEERKIKVKSMSCKQNSENVSKLSKQEQSHFCVTSEVVCTNE